MNLVQKRRDALHFVHDDHPIARDVRELKGKQPGVGEEGLVAGFVQEIDDVRVRECASRPRALARTADAVEEETALGRDEKTAVLAPCHHAVILLCIMTAW